MRTQVDRDAPRDAILAEGDAAFAAWSLEEIEDDLESVRSAFADEDLGAA